MQQPTNTNIKALLQRFLKFKPNRFLKPARFCAVIALNITTPTPAAAAPVGSALGPTFE